MRINKQARREAKELFRSCQQEGMLVEDRVRQAVKLVMEKKPRGYLPMLTHFQRLVKLDIARRTARIESALALSDDLKEKVKANLTRLHGQGLAFSFVVNPELLGGLRIQVGSDVYDGSIRSRLSELEESFSV